MIWYDNKILDYSGYPGSSLRVSSTDNQFIRSNTFPGIEVENDATFVVNFVINNSETDFHIFRRSFSTSPSAIVLRYSYQFRMLVFNFASQDSEGLKCNEVRISGLDLYEGVNYSVLVLKRGYNASEWKLIINDRKDTHVQVNQINENCYVPNHNILNGLGATWTGEELANGGFDGYFSNFQVYRSLLSDFDIKRVRSGLPALEVTPEIYLSFHQTEGNIALDKTGNYNYELINYDTEATERNGGAWVDTYSITKPFYYSKLTDYKRSLGNCIKVTGGPRKHPVYTQSDVTVHKDVYESLSLWVYMPAEILSVAHGLWFFMIGNGIFSGNRMGLTQFSRSSMILYWYNGAQVAQVNVLNNQIVSGQWNNITVNIKGTDMADYDVWINGNKKMLNPISSPDTSDWHTSPVGYSIGLQGNINANPAYLSSFMWFNRNLSENEVRQINKQHGICPFPLKNNLRFYCLFNEKNGQSVKNLVDETSSSDLILYNYTDQETATSPFSQSDNTVWCDSYTLQPIH